MELSVAGSCATAGGRGLTDQPDDLNEQENHCALCIACGPGRGVARPGPGTPGDWGSAPGPPGGH